LAHSGSATVSSTALNSIILFRVVAAVLSAALYPNIIKVLTPEVKYKQTATGIFLKDIIINHDYIYYYYYYHSNKIIAIIFCLQQQILKTLFI